MNNDMCVSQRETAGDRRPDITKSECSPDLQSKLRRFSIAFLGVLVIAVVSMSSVIPPFQSPDEFNHIKRAYLLSKGRVFLDERDGQTGGAIDSGLLVYMTLFTTLPFNYQQKVTQKTLRNSKEIHWSHEEHFSELPNTAVYFPLSYAPQAVALLIGEHAELSVNDTYYLARALSLAAIVAILWAATVLYPVPLPVLAMFALPMALFQLGSASLDGVSFAMCVLVGSLFMRASHPWLYFTWSMHVTFAVCLLLLATSRTNLLGATWLPFGLYIIRGRRSYLISASVVIALSLLWVSFAALTVKGTQIQSVSPARVILNYLAHPHALFSVIASTLASGRLLSSYWRMFVGVLGWLDTPLDLSIYIGFAALLTMLALVSVQTDIGVLVNPGRASLVGAAIVSALLLFVIFLATYTLHPAKVVSAVQGRYFYPSAIFLGFALFDRRTSPRQLQIAGGLVIATILLSVVTVVPKLIGRYWAS